MCIRHFYGTYYCQRLYINCLAIACKLNMNLLIVRQIGDTCSPLSSWSSWSSSEDWDKYLIPNSENSHVLSAWATFSYGLGSSEMLLAESSNLYVVAVLTMLSHDINCLSAFSLQWLLTLLGTGLPAPVRAKYPHGAHIESVLTVLWLAAVTVRL